MSHKKIVLLIADCGSKRDTEFPQFSIRNPQSAIHNRHAPGGAVVGFVGMVAYLWDAAGSFRVLSSYVSPEKLLFHEIFDSSKLFR